MEFELSLTWLESFSKLKQDEFPCVERPVSSDYTRVSFNIKHSGKGRAKIAEV